MEIKIIGRELHIEVKNLWADRDLDIFSLLRVGEVSGKLGYTITNVISGGEDGIYKFFGEER